MSTKYKLYDEPDALIANKLLQLGTISIVITNFILIIFRDLQIIFRIS
mgnify:FL=1